MLADDAGECWVVMWRCDRGDGMGATFRAGVGAPTAASTYPRGDTFAHQLVVVYIPCSEAIAATPELLFHCGGGPLATRALSFVSIR